MLPLHDVALDDVERPCCRVKKIAALRHFEGHFGRGQVTYPHCYQASLLGSLPVLSAHFSPVADN